MSFSIPPYLKPGDTIGLISTARRINKEELQFACNFIEEKGFTYRFGEHLFGADNQFSGTDKERAADLRQMINDTNIKAILCVRGGYGTVRLLDLIHWEAFKQHPKWICGYSDITALHSLLQNDLGIASIHSTMPISFKSNSKEALNTLFDHLQGNCASYEFPSHELNRKGDAEGVIIGGNLSVLYSMMGSKDQAQTKGKILFLEDLDEYLYHIDRMLQNMKRAGLFEGLAGLIIGGMTDMNDNTVPFGRNAEEIISDICKDYNFPIAYNFPAGHIDDNRAITFGKKVKLELGDKSKLTYI